MPFPIRISFFSSFLNQSRFFSSNPLKLSSSSGLMEAKQQHSEKEAPISEKMFISAPTIGSYKCFIVVFRAYGEAHSPQKVVDLFHRMVDEFRCTRTIKLLNVVLNVIINERLYRRALEFHDYVALCNLGFVDRTVEVFRGMRERKCLPDGYTYCTLMDGLCKEEIIDEAVLLLDVQSEGYSQSSVIYNLLINGLCKSGFRV